MGSFQLRKMTPGLYSTGGHYSSLHFWSKITKWPYPWRTHIDLIYFLVMSDKICCIKQFAFITSIRLIALSGFYRMTLSVWLYVLEYCQRGLCGIVTRMNKNSNYLTPMIFLTRDGILFLAILHLFRALILFQLFSKSLSDVLFYFSWIQRKNNIFFKIKKLFNK